MAIQNPIRNTNTATENACKNSFKSITLSYFMQVNAYLDYNDVKYQPMILLPSVNPRTKPFTSAVQISPPIMLFLYTSRLAYTVPS